MHTGFLVGSTSESKDWQSLPRPVVECMQVLRVRVAKESVFDQLKFGRVDQGEAAFLLRKAKCRCNRLAPAKRPVAGIDGVIPQPEESLPFPVLFKWPLFYWVEVVRPGGFELPAFWFVGKQSKILSAAPGVAYRGTRHLSRS